jgi:D-alanyl-D-alanine carboxypeptidase/D-alanyl-D-alanine-endopeptidase (penicillin-binding protein 4)
MADQVPALLSQSIGYTVKLYPFTVDNTKAKTLYSMPKEPIIRQMMEESDNFIAEHLLLGCGSVLRDSLSTTYVIDTLLSGLMSHLQPRPKWVDGSGLSRYNLMTPDMIIALLRDMYKGFGESKIFSMLGHGGGKGTLKRFYNDQASPYVYAKTGTLSGVFCLSGYMIVRSGRRIAFSVMNNHFDNSASKARTDVQRLLKQVYLTY